MTCSDLCFGQFFETIQQRKEVLLILLNEIDPYMLKVGDLTGDLAISHFPSTIITVVIYSTI